MDEGVGEIPASQSRSCIVSCMDDSESRKLWLYRMFTYDLTADEIQDLSNHLEADFTRIEESAKGDVPYGIRVGSWKVLVEFVLSSKVLLPSLEPSAQAH